MIKQNPIIWSLEWNRESITARILTERSRHPIFQVVLLSTKKWQWSTLVSSAVSGLGKCHTYLTVWQHGVLHCMTATSEWYPLSNRKSSLPQVFFFFWVETNIFLGHLTNVSWNNQKMTDSLSNAAELGLSSTWIWMNKFMNYNILSK